MLIKRIVAPLILALIMLSVAIPVYAADYQNILSAGVYRNLLEADDMLVVFHYDLHYDTTPSTPVNKYFHFQLLDTAGANVLATATPYVYFNQGFDEGAGCFYFSPDDAPDWGDPYIIKIRGNPEYHSGSIPEVTYTLADADYCAFVTREEIRDALGEYILGVAHSLQADWVVEMTTNSDLGEILTSPAASYFQGTIEGIQYMSPQIFAVQESAPIIPTPLHPGTDQADAYATRFDDTFIGDFMASGLFGIPGNVVTGMGIAIFGLVAFVISARMFGTTIPGMIAAYAIILMGFTMGFMNAAIFGIITLLAAIYTGYIVFFRNATG